MIRRKIRSLTRIVSRSRERERDRERGCSSRGAYNSGGSKERLLASGRPHAVIINSGGMHYRDAGSVGEQPPGTRIYLAPSRHQAFPSMLFANMFFPRSRNAFFAFIRIFSRLTNKPTNVLLEENHLRDLVTIVL